MENTKFILSCESTVDMPYSYMEKRNIPVLFYQYNVDGFDYQDDMLRDPEALNRFYQFLAQGKIPKTSQVNESEYEQYLASLLEKGDVLHIAFGSGMTRSVENAKVAAELLRRQYPDRQLVIVDSTCSSSGYGMLVDYAADLRDEGKTIDETASWVLENCHRIHHQFFSTELDYYRKSGRMSGPAAMIGTVLNICPIMRLNDQGKIIAYDKVRGKKKAIMRTIDTMEAHAEGGTQYAGKCFISHSKCREDAELTKRLLKERFPLIQGDIPIYDIGTIIASHCGPGTVAVYFVGDLRAH